MNDTEPRATGSGPPGANRRARHHVRPGRRSDPYAVLFSGSGALNLSSNRQTPCRSGRSRCSSPAKVWHGARRWAASAAVPCPGHLRRDRRRPARPPSPRFPARSGGRDRDGGDRRRGPAASLALASVGIALTLTSSAGADATPLIIVAAAVSSIIVDVLESRQERSAAEARSPPWPPRSRFSPAMASRLIRSSIAPRRNQDDPTKQRPAPACSPQEVRARNDRRMRAARSAIRT
jgi:hypothetical protein